MCVRVSVCVHTCERVCTYTCACVLGWRATTESVALNRLGQVAQIAQALFVPLPFRKGTSRLRKNETGFVFCWYKGWKANVADNIEYTLVCATVHDFPRKVRHLTGGGLPYSTTL